VTALRPGSHDSQAKRLEAFFVMVLLISQISVFSGAVAQGIVEEKASRVVEVLAATIRPTQLLVGKLIGIGLASLLQLASLAAIGLLATTTTGILHLDSTDVGVLVQVLPWFLLFFTFSAALHAAAAATVSRQEDLQSAIAPLQVLMFSGIIVGQFGITDADRPLVHVLSYVPPFSPVLMAERWAGGLVGWGEVLVSMGLMAAAAAAVTAVGSRIYLERILYFGSRVTLWQAMRRSPATQ
jgi:ABC-2 type transport system permease protein